MTMERGEERCRSSTSSTTITDRDRAAYNFFFIGGARETLTSRAPLLTPLLLLRSAGSCFETSVTRENAERLMSVRRRGLVTIAGCGRRLIGGRRKNLFREKLTSSGQVSLRVSPRPSALISFFWEQRPVTSARSTRARAKVAVTVISRRDYKVRRYDYRRCTLRFYARVFLGYFTAPVAPSFNSRFDNALFVTPSIKSLHTCACRNEILTVDRNESSECRIFWRIISRFSRWTEHSGNRGRLCPGRAKTTGKSKRKRRRREKDR